MRRPAKTKRIPTNPRTNPPGATPAKALPLPGSSGFWAVLVGLIAVALYLPAIGFDLVYDSNSQILIDDFIHQPRHLWDVLTLRVMGLDVLDFNRPVNLFSLMIDSLLWGKNPAGYHLTNVLLHGATAALLFRWLHGLVGQLAPALIAALLFAVHPLHCEAVVEVGNREDLLATLFLLAGLLCATRFHPGDTSPPRATAPGSSFQPPWLPALATVLFLFLSVASKESGVAGPATLVVYWWVFRRREKRRPWLILLAITGILACAFMAVRFALAPKNSIIFTEAPAPIASHWIDLAFIQGRIFAAEFRRIVWPADLCADYNGYSIQSVSMAVAILSIALLVIAQAYFSTTGRHRRLFALASALFWFSLLPVANLIPIYRPMADRFLYMPMTGVALTLAVALAGLGTPRTGRGWPLPTMAPYAAVCAAVVALALASWGQEHVWRDAPSLWKQTVERNPLSFNGWLGCGYVFIEHNEPAKAVDAFNRASALAQGNRAEPFAGAAIAAESMGRHREACQALSRAVALDARYTDPDRLSDALTLEPVYVARLKAIALRLRKGLTGSSRAASPLENGVDPPQPKTS